MEQAESQGVPRNCRQSPGGTAVNVQSMVFGNLGETSGGVCFTRRPDTGENLSSANTSSTDMAKSVVAQVFEHEPISTLFEKMPVVAQSLQDTLDKLEMHFKNMQDIEFSVILASCLSCKRETVSAVV